jgi:RNA 2',3'-cyclic 3'-phosphodiesterase
VAERLFFALWPGEPERLALDRVRRTLPAHRGRETEPADYHVTLSFLGDVDPERRACAEAAAGQVRAAPFTLVLDTIGSFSRARILWCGASECPPGLLALVGGLNHGLLDCGLPPERRPYQPHVTLARKAVPVEARSLPEPICWPVDSFALVRSEPQHNPRYRVLASWALAP